MCDCGNCGVVKADVVVGKRCGGGVVVRGGIVVWKVMYQSFSMEGRYDDDEDDDGGCVVVLLPELLLVAVASSQPKSRSFMYSWRRACVITERVSASRAWTCVAADLKRLQHVLLSVSEVVLASRAVVFMMQVFRCGARTGARCVRASVAAS